MTGWKIWEIIKNKKNWWKSELMGKKKILFGWKEKCDDDRKCSLYKFILIKKINSLIFFLNVVSIKNK